MGSKTRAGLGAIFALFLIPGLAAAHTGTITADQTCAGYTISGHLNADVAATSTWVVDLNGAQLAAGTGPGPADLGPYTGPVTTGTAHLTITFGSEVNVYSATLPQVGDCASAAPSATPTPSRGGIHPPKPTPPVTSTYDTAVTETVGLTFGVLVVGLLVVMAVAVAVARRVK